MGAKKINKKSATVIRVDTLILCFWADKKSGQPRPTDKKQKKNKFVNKFTAKRNEQRPNKFSKKAQEGREKQAEDKKAQKEKKQAEKQAEIESKVDFSNRASDESQNQDKKLIHL